MAGPSMASRTTYLGPGTKSSTLARIRFLAIFRTISKTIATITVATAMTIAMVYSLSKLDNLFDVRGSRWTFRPLTR